jgi:predicted secreted protein
MKWPSALAIYFIIWWVVLFAVLPFGVKNAHENDAKVGDGHDAGAPVAPLLLRKALVTTLVAAAVFAAFAWAKQMGLLDFGNW